MTKIQEAERMFWSAGLATPIPIEHQAGLLKETQDELLNECQRVIDRWCARRHETTEALFGLTDDCVHSQAPLQLAEAWSHWLTGAVERASDDLRDQIKLSMTGAKTLGNGYRMSHLKYQRQPRPTTRVEGTRRRRRNPCVIIRWKLIGAGLRSRAKCMRQSASRVGVWASLSPAHQRRIILRKLQWRR